MSLRNTFPGFMGSGDDEMRTALVRDGELSTMVIQGDWMTPEQRDRRLHGDGAFRATTGNEIAYLDDARQAFRQMGDLFSRASAGDYIFVLGWMIQLDTQLVPDPDSPEAEEAPRLDSTVWRRPGRLGRALVDAAERGAQVFVIVWGGSPTAEAMGGPFMLITGTDQTERHRHVQEQLAPWSNIHVIVDANAHSLGAHHQKLVLVKYGNRSVAFYGGMDLAPNRYLGGGWYDLHARVRGPAVGWGPKSS